MIDAIVQPWRADAACAGQDPAIWYPERGQTVDAAVAICAGCPVRAECAEYGLSLGAAEPGVWGGLSWRERRQILRGQTPSVRRPRRPAECGTPAGYTRHRKAGEAACGECRAAVAAYQRERSRRLREEWAS